MAGMQCEEGKRRELQPQGREEGYQQGSLQGLQLLSEGVRKGFIKDITLEMDLERLSSVNMFVFYPMEGGIADLFCNFRDDRCMYQGAFQSTHPVPKHLHAASLGVIYGAMVGAPLRPGIGIAYTPARQVEAWNRC